MTLGYLTKCDFTLLSYVKGRLGENRSLILRTVAHNPRWKKWFGIRNGAISTNPVRFLRGQIGDSDNIDLNLNITQVAAEND